MAAITNNDVNEIVEELYTDGIVQIGFSKDTPFWSRVPKKATFHETTLNMRNRYGLNPSGSRTFTEARSRTGASPFGVFGLTRAHDYQALQFTGETYRSLRAANVKRAVSIVEEETKSSFERAAKRMNHSMYRNAGGAITQVASGGATQTITVSQRELLINIHPRMWLTSDITDGSAGGTDDANATQVLSVDREAGTITTAAASWDAIAGFSDNDFIFAVGDFGLALFGLDTWVPAVAPTDTFLGQNRALDPVYLGGIRYQAQAGAPDGTIYRALVGASAEGQIHGARTDDIYMHPLDFALFIKELEPNIHYERMLARRGGYGDKDAMFDVGITGIEVHLPTGMAYVMSDLDCPRNVFWMIDNRTFTFYGLESTGPDWLIHDDLGKFQRMTQSGVDGIEATIGYYGNLGCEAPGCNIRVDATLVLN